MDYKKVQEHYVDSMSQYDLNELLKNSKHWELDFSSLQVQVDEMAKIIYELELQDYRTTLPRWIINEIDSFRGNLIQYINLIKDFTISQPNASDVRNSYLNQVQSFYNNGFYRVEEILNNLKIKKLLQDKTWLNEQINSLWRLETMTSALEKARTELEKKTTEIKSISNLWNESWNLQSSHFFLEQSSNHWWRENKGNWLWQRNKFLIFLWFWVIWHYLTYLFYWPYWTITHAIEHWLFFLLWFALLYFWFSFATNNYYIEKGLEIENKHRSNIANTAPLLQLWATTDSAKDIVIAEQVKALFAPIWWKMEWKWTEITTPFLEIIKSLISKV